MEESTGVHIFLSSSHNIKKVTQFDPLLARSNLSSGSQDKNR